MINSRRWEVIGETRQFKTIGELEMWLCPLGGLWRNIMNGWDDFEVNISMKVGDGRRVNFWG